jgi:integrase
MLRARKAARRTKPGAQKSKGGVTLSEQLAEFGFLVGKKRWNPATVRTRRGYISSLAKAVVAATDLVPETIEELTDPEYLEVAAEVLEERNQGVYSSGYIHSVLGAALKLGRDFVGRKAEEVELIQNLRSFYKVSSKGMSPRNRAKLQQFSDQSIQDTIDLSGTIIADINREISDRRQAYRKSHGSLPKQSDVIDVEMARDIAAALAHDIMLARAPRSANLLQARLDWIVFRDDWARIVVPAPAVKLRDKGDADYTIQLGTQSSQLLRMYLDTVRGKLLQDGDEANPHVFPTQKQRDRKPGTPYISLLKRVTRLIKRHVGVTIHPHLYRHLIGWIWLKDDIDNLPKVSKLLGHRSLQTTIDHYAELDESLVFQEWQDRLDRNSAKKKNE